MNTTDSLKIPRYYTAYYSAYFTFPFSFYDGISAFHFQKPFLITFHIYRSAELFISVAHELLGNIYQWRLEYNFIDFKCYNRNFTLSSITQRHYACTHVFSQIPLFHVIFRLTEKH
jgi:hypothetical protein